MTAELNLRKVDRKQDLNVLYKVCVFWADPKTKMWQQMWHIVLRCMICGPLGLLFFIVIINYIHVIIMYIMCINFVL